MVKYTVSRHTSCICKTRLPHNASVLSQRRRLCELWLCWASWVTRGKDKDGIQGLEWSFFTTDINKSSCAREKDKQFMYSIFPHTISKKKKENLRAVNYCTRSACVLCRIRLPFRASQRNICLTNVWAGPSEALLILIQTHRHWRSILKVGKKWWKYIHYKVVMKSPAGSSER